MAILCQDEALLEGWNINFNDKDFTNRPYHYGPVPVRPFYGLKRED